MNKIQLFTCMVAEINSLFHEAAYRCGIPDSVLTTLYVLYGNEGSAEISSVCRLTGLRKQTLNAALRRLEFLGLISLERGKGKNKVIVLSQKGRELAEATAGAMCVLSERAVGNWSEEDLTLIMDFAADFLQNFRELITELPKVSKIDLLRQAKVCQCSASQGAEEAPKAAESSLQGSESQ